jgi:ElaB/YqjD/DUF883 family membrane-anchored ribosome-binding protein
MFNHSKKTIGIVSDNISDSIMDALKVLDEAAGEKGHEIRAAVHQSFKNLGRAFSEIESGSEAAMDFVEKKGKNIREGVVRETAKTIEDLEHQFKTRPWMFLGGFAILGLGVGYLIGRKS